MEVEPSPPAHCGEHCAWQSTGGAGCNIFHCAHHRQLHVCDYTCPWRSATGGMDERFRPVMVCRISGKQSVVRLNLKPAGLAEKGAGKRFGDDAMAMDGGSYVTPIASGSKRVSCAPVAPTHCGGLQ